MSGEVIQALVEVLKSPGLLVRIYGDLAKPGVQQVGKALGGILGLGNTVLWPIHLMNERARIFLQANLEAYRHKLETVPMARIVEVQPEIGVPIAEKLAYVRDIKLADMYVALLATASDADTVGEAHPSFVNIINNLCPDEAKLLELFVSREAIEILTAKWILLPNNDYNIISDLLIAPEQFKSLIYPGNAPAYIANLAGLGLIAVHRDRAISDPGAYEESEAYWNAHYSAATPPTPSHKLAFDRGVAAITVFGSLFIRACHNSA